MFCVKCGVELAPGQAVCPLCETRVYHPDLPIEGSPAYPQKPFQSEAFNRRGLLFVITILCLLPLTLPMALELSIYREVNWSGYVTGGVILGYILAVLPLWFRRWHPTVFIPCDFAAVLVYLLYIDLQTGGGWFLPFAFPVVGALGVIVAAISTLTRYVRRGHLYIFGGGLIALGAWTVLIEGMIAVAFHITFLLHWSMISFITLFLLGILLILIAIIRPLRESLRKIFFIGRG